MLYGNLDRMLAPHLDGDADLVVPGTNSAKMQGSTQGHLTVVRNHRHTNDLAIRDPTYAEVLASEEHWAYDETSWRHGGDVSSFTKILKDAARRQLLLPIVRQIQLSPRSTRAERPSRITEMVSPSATPTTFPVKRS